MNSSSYSVLKVVKPVYRIPESGLHCFLTYLDHNISTLNMEQSRVDPCLLSQKNNGSLSAMVTSEVADCVIVGSESFLRTKNEMSAVFSS